MPLNGYIGDVWAALLKNWAPTAVTWAAFAAAVGSERTVNAVAISALTSVLSVAATYYVVTPVTMARFDERLIAMEHQRKLIIAARDKQLADRDSLVEGKMGELRIDVTKLHAEVVRIQAEFVKFQIEAARGGR